MTIGEIFSVLFFVGSMWFSTGIAASTNGIMVMGDLPTLQPNSPILLQKCLKTAKSAKNVRFAVILNTNLSTYSSYMIDKIQISSILFLK